MLFNLFLGSLAAKNHLSFEEWLLKGKILRVKIVFVSALFNCICLAGFFDSQETSLAYVQWLLKGETKKNKGSMWVSTSQLMWVSHMTKWKSQSIYLVYSIEVLFAKYLKCLTLFVLLYYCNIILLSAMYNPSHCLFVKTNRGEVYLFVLVVCFKIVVAILHYTTLNYFEHFKLFWFFLLFWLCRN